MSTIQFDNGTKVQFDGTPTSADVDEVATKMGIGSSGQSGGGIGSFLNKTSDVIQGIFPNKNIGKIIGTGVGGVMTALTDSGNLKNYDWNPHASVGGIASDVGGDALNAASLLAAPETGGASLGARMGTNAAIGGGLNLANSLSNGKSITDSGVLADAAGSATLSAFLPVLGKPFEAVANSAKEASGVTPQIETALMDSHPEEVKDYIQTVLAHNKDLNTPTATGLMASKLNDATDIITQKLKIAGQAVGDVLRQEGSKKIGDNPQTGNALTDDILSNFNQKLENTFGHEITPVSNATAKLNIAGQTITDATTLPEPSLNPLVGRSRVIDPSDQKRILAIHAQITDLAKNPTITKASDVVHNLDNLIDYSKVDQVGINHDPLQGIILSTRGEINGAIRSTSPEVAAANDRFSQLKGIEEEIGQKAGNDMQRSALVMRRVFSGDQSGKSLQMFNDIKNETGIDLTKHAALAKFATDNFGNESSRSLLQQEINAGGSVVGGMKRALLTPLKKAVSAVLVPNTESYATKVASGGKYANMLDELLNSDKGRGLVRTYLNNVSAAHPNIGKGINRSIENLIGNATGLRF